MPDASDSKPYVPDMALPRCAWAGDDPLYVAYHDTLWGVPVYDSRALFEKLTLDGFQAGLSWLTILKKRENFRRAFDDFQPEIVAAYGADKVEELLADKGIVRHRGKITATINNARACLRIEQEFDGGFSGYLWGFVGGAPIQNAWPDRASVPTESEISRAMSRELKKRGFRFVGPTIVYAFMEAVGMLNNHTTDCYRHRELGGSGERGGRGA